MTSHSRNRRRGKDLEAAILQAVWDELHEHGYAGLTMEGVARRAGTSKPVLYRRWSTRAEMMAATAMHFLPSTDTVPDRGNLRDNLIGLLQVMRQRMRTVGRSTILGLLLDVTLEPELEAIAHTFMDYMRTIMNEVVIARALQTGEVTEDQFNDRLRTLPMELARMEFLINGDLPDRSLEEIVDDVFLPALRARPASKP